MYITNHLFPEGVLTGQDTQTSKCTSANINNFLLILERNEAQWLLANIHTSHFNSVSFILVNKQKMHASNNNAIIINFVNYYHATHELNYLFKEPRLPF